MSHSFTTYCRIFLPSLVSHAYRCVSTLDTIRTVFDDVTAEALAEHQTEMVTHALATARHIASTYLADGPGRGLKPDLITDTLIRQQREDPNYDHLAPFEKRWMLLVIRLLDPAIDPRAAVEYAHMRGASWTDIGAALGLSRQTAHKRYARTLDISLP
jgi:DNA-directed RNA polymerase specialized sigma24 family protein